MADDREGRPPGPSRADKGKAKVGEPMEVIPEEDEPQKIEPDPEPGDDDPGDPNDPNNGPRDGEMCFMKFLTAREVDPPNPVLLLDAYEAFLLTLNNKFMEPPSTSYSKSISVFDGGCEIYMMLISYCACGNWVGYSVTGDWGLFVQSHNMKAGDKIVFYRVVNPDVVEDCYYYEIRYERAPHIKAVPISSAWLDEKEGLQYLNMMQEIEPHPDSGRELQQGLRSLDLNWKNSPEPGPGSRDMPDEGICLSKTLSELEVLNKDGHPRLLMTAHEACLFIRCPNIAQKYTSGNLSLNLVVFDAENEQYDMLLSHFESPGNGRLIYTLDAGWQRFMKFYNLQAGDEVYFYRLTDENINKGRAYYVVRYKRMNLPSGGESLPPVSESVPTGRGSDGVGPTGGSSGGGPTGDSSTKAGPSGSSGEGVGPSGGGDEKET